MTENTPQDATENTTGKESVVTPPPASSTKTPDSAGAQAGAQSGAQAGAQAGAKTGAFDAKSSAREGEKQTLSAASLGEEVAFAENGLSAFSHVPVEVQVVLGRARLPIGSILRLGRGAVVEIDRKVGEQVDIHINHRPVARGEIIIVDEDRLGVTLTEIIDVQAGLQ